jgi:PhzF family phenazine biosynthesis protein
MPTSPIYQVDAFTDHLFGGNPAAVCFLDQWPGDSVLQHIASENNLPETAFLVRGQDGFELRWFTPTLEVDLCGHATLAAAHVLFNIQNYSGPEIRFKTRSGQLKAIRQGQKVVLDFPADPPRSIEILPGLLDALGLSNGTMYKGKTDMMVVVEAEDTVLSSTPNFHQLRKIAVRGVIVTAPGKEVDFVSRFFAPGSGIDEDPVTGSAHCTMTPYWSERLGKTTLEAVQLSPRRGAVHCELADDRVKLTGTAVTYLSGSICY